MRNLIESQALCVEVCSNFSNLSSGQGNFFSRFVQVLDAGLARLAQQRPETVLGDSSSVVQLLGIFDLRNLSPFNVDIEFISFLIEIVYK